MLVIYAKFIDYTVNICVIFYNLLIILQWTFNEINELLINQFLPSELK